MAHRHARFFPTWVKSGSAVLVCFSLYPPIPIRMSVREMFPAGCYPSGRSRNGRSTEEWAALTDLRSVVYMRKKGTGGVEKNKKEECLRFGMLQIGRLFTPRRMAANAAANAAVARHEHHGGVPVKIRDGKARLASGGGRSRRCRRCHRVRQRPDVRHGGDQTWGDEGSTGDSAVAGPPTPELGAAEGRVRCQLGRPSGG